MFKKSFVPRINAALEKRESFIKRLTQDVKALESEIAAINEKIQAFQLEEAQKTTVLIKNAIKKSSSMLEEQLQLLKSENEELINGTRKRFRDEIQGLTHVFKMQIDITAAIIYERLFLSEERL
jgi:F0F1-type ATP synthase membrane subunit b/b'